MGEPSIKTGKRGHDESVYGTVVEMIADFERQFLKKNKTIDYQGAMEYIAMKAGYDYLKIGAQAMDLFFKSRRVRKSTVLNIIVDTVSTVRPEAILGHEQEIVKYALTMSCKHSNDRLFVASCAHLFATIGVVSRKQEVWNSAMDACIATVETRNDMNRKSLCSLFIENALSKRRELELAESRKQEMIDIKKSGKVEFLEDEDDRAIEMFNSEFAKLQDAIPKLRLVLKQTEEQSKTVPYMIVEIVGAIYKLSVGINLSKVSVYPQRKLPAPSSTGGQTLRKRVYSALSNLLTFAQPFAVEPFCSRQTHFLKTARLAVKTVLLHNSDVNEETEKWEPYEEGVLADLERFQAWPWDGRNKRSKALLLFEKELGRTVQAMKNRRYSIRVHRVCPTVPAIDVFETEQALEIGTTFVPRKSEVEEYVDYVETQAQEDIYFYNMELGDVQWEHPEEREKRLGKAGGTKQVFHWKGDPLEFERFPGHYCEINGKDLAYLLQNTGMKNALANIKQNTKLRREFLEYSKACQVLARGIRRHLAVQLVNKMKERVREEREGALLCIEDSLSMAKEKNARERKRKEAAAKRHRRAVLAKSHKRVYQKQTYAACTIQRYWGKFIILKKIRFIIAWHEDNQKTEALGSKFVIAESKRFQQELKRNRTKRRTKIHRYVKNADEFRKAADRYQKEVWFKHKMHKYKVFRKELEREMEEWEWDPALAEKQMMEFEEAEANRALVVDEGESSGDDEEFRKWRS